MTTRLETVVWVNGAVEFVDQTLLPHEEVMRRCDSVDLVIDAIARLVVRGAPAIGVAGAYGVALAASRHHPENDAEKFRAEVQRIRDAHRTSVAQGMAYYARQANLAEQKLKLEAIFARGAQEDEATRVETWIAARGAEANPGCAINRARRRRVWRYLS